MSDMGENPGSSTHLLWAVRDDAESGLAVSAPADPGDAHRLREAHDFYCSPRAGGCGGRVDLTAGMQRIPYFRHATKAGCSFVNDPAGRDTYTHMAIQQAIRDWVHQSEVLKCQLEYIVEDRRTDILIQGPDISVSLEVQLSRISQWEVATRTGTYRKAARTVQWLWGSPSIAGFQSEMNRRGHALCIHWHLPTATCRLGVSYYTAGQSGWGFTTAGGPLNEWTVTGEGLSSKHLQTAAEGLAARKKWEDAASARAAEEAARYREQIAREVELARTQEEAIEYWRVQREEEARARAAENERLAGEAWARLLSPERRLGAIPSNQ